jgi:sulfoxide reductase heme-binding subunit YedZ
MDHMNDLAWFLSRSSGIVALVLGVASLALGVLFSARQTGTRRRPNWWLDLHNWLGGLTLWFTVVHMVALLAARDLGVGVAQLLVPGVDSAYDDLGMLTGVSAFYAFAVVVLTSWPRKRLRRAAWHLVHLLAVPAVVLGGLHGYLVGSDATSPLLQGLLAVLAGLCVHPLVLRLWGLAVRRRRRPSGAPPRPARPTVAFRAAPAPYPPVPLPAPIDGDTLAVATRATGGR